MTVRPALYRARWVLPVTAPAIRDGAVLVDDAGRIAGVGAAASIAAPDGIDVHDLGEAVLLPGLVNTHMHLELSLLRGLLDDLTFTEWIPALLAIKRDAALTEDDYAVAARWSLIEAVAAGITTIGATEDSAAGLHALLESGQRGVVYREVFGPAPEQCEESHRAARTAARARWATPRRTGSASASRRTRPSPCPSRCSERWRGSRSTAVCRSPSTPPSHARNRSS